LREEIKSGVDFGVDEEAGFCLGGEPGVYFHKRDFVNGDLFVRDAAAFADALEGAKVVASYRAPDVVRFGLSPLYHRYADIWALGERLRQLETVRMQ